MFNTLRTIIAAAAVAGSLPAAAQAQTADPSAHNVAAQGVRNVVLVHGAFADGSGWRGVYDELTQRGYHVTIVQNPLTSLADDVAATKRALDRQDGPAILVGHSWSGTVITEAGVDPKVAGLVYVSALSPDAGETTAQQYEGFVTPPEFVIDTHGDGFGFVKPENFKIGFAADVSDADAGFMRDSQVPIAMSVFATKLSQAAWRSKPSWAVIATDDKAFDLRMLRHMAGRIGAKVTEVPASHAVFMTQPKAVADVIDEAAKTAPRQER
jgi:pimeloyl-ACP methyl ester carboxylesterase